MADPCIQEDIINEILPFEILCLIFSFCDKFVYLTLMHVCKRWRDAAMIVGNKKEALESITECYYQYDKISYQVYVGIDVGRPSCNALDFIISSFFDKLKEKSTSFIENRPEKNKILNIVHAAIRNHDLFLVKWLETTFHFSKNGQEDGNRYYWIRSCFRFTPTYWNKQSPETIAVHLKIADYMNEIFEMEWDPNDNFGNIRHAFLSCADYVQTDWMIRALGIKSTKIPLCHWFLQCLEHKNAPRMAIVLNKHYSETLYKTIHDEKNKELLMKMLRACCRDDNVTCFEWFVTQFEITNEQLMLRSKTCGSMFKFACSCGYISIVKWLYKNLSYAQNYVINGIIVAKIKENQNIVSWLESELKL